MKVLSASADELDIEANVLTLMLASLDCSGKVCWI